MNSRMDQVISSLAGGSEDVCLQFCSLNLSAAGPAVEPPDTPFCAVSLDLVGDLRGRIHYCLDEVSALRIVSGMMLGTQLETIDELASSALMELGNMMAGSSCTRLGDYGMTCDISPPRYNPGSEWMAEYSPRRANFFSIRMQGEAELYIILDLERPR